MRQKNERNSGKGNVFCFPRNEINRRKKLEGTSATLMKEKRKIDTNKMFSRNNKQRFG